VCARGPRRCVLLAAAVAWLPAACKGGAGDRVRFASVGGRVVVTVGENQPFAAYQDSGPRGPAVWPLCAPGGVPVTRAFPFAEVDGEPRDHPHHQSLWFAHGAVNGVDFWQGQGARIVAAGAIEADAATATVRHASEWRGPDDAVVCRDARAVRFVASREWRAVDVAITLSAGEQPLRLGDTKEGTMALRLRPELCLEGPRAAGSLQTSEGLRGAEAWGKPARWVAYSGPVEGAPVTVAMFDHPGNHGHPTHWHARGYGLCAANPFGLHDFTGAPRGAGDLVLPAGGDLRLRYRVWLARGAADVAAIEAAYRAWVEER
jgi:hypothetical protein